MGPAHHVPGHAGVHPAVPLLHTLDGVDVGQARRGGSLKHREVQSNLQISSEVLLTPAL